jgi:hypothetical protein
MVTLSKNIFSFCGAFRHSGERGEKFFCISQTDLESLSSVYEDVYVVVKRSICYSSLVLQKEKGLSDLKFREEICLSVCVSVEALFCEDESQKDFERETLAP